LSIGARRRSSERLAPALRKSRQYRLIPSAQEIVLISQGRRSVEVHRRNAKGRFELYEWTQGTAELRSVNALVALDALYADAEALRANR
jgi:Uma2 family endonuclease